MYNPKTLITPNHESAAVAPTKIGPSNLYSEPSQPKSYHSDPKNNLSNSVGEGNDDAEAASSVVAPVHTLDLLDGRLRRLSLSIPLLSPLEFLVTVEKTTLHSDHANRLHLSLNLLVDRNLKRVLHLLCRCSCSFLPPWVCLSGCLIFALFFVCLCLWPLVFVLISFPLFSFICYALLILYPFVRFCELDPLNPAFCPVASCSDVGFCCPDLQCFGSLLWICLFLDSFYNLTSDSVLSLSSCCRLVWIFVWKIWIVFGHSTSFVCLVNFAFDFEFCLKPLNNLLVVFPWFTRTLSLINLRCFLPRWIPRIPCLPDNIFFLLNFPLNKAEPLCMLCYCWTHNPLICKLKSFPDYLHDDSDYLKPKGICVEPLQSLHLETLSLKGKYVCTRTQNKGSGMGDPHKFTEQSRLRKANNSTNYYSMNNYMWIFISMTHLNLSYVSLNNYKLLFYLLYETGLFLLNFKDYVNNDYSKPCLRLLCSILSTLDYYFMNASGLLCLLANSEMVNLQIPNNQKQTQKLY